MALGLGLLDFEIGDRGEKLRVPIDQALVLVDQPSAIELDEDLAHGARKPLVHGEAEPRPIAGGAEALQLADDGVAGLFFPLPDPLDELLAARGRGGSAPAAPSIGARPPSGWRCRHGRCPAATARRCPRMRSKRTSTSCSVLLSACPICSEPVTFGGGMTMAKGLAPRRRGRARTRLRPPRRDRSVLRSKLADKSFRAWMTVRGLRTVAVPAYAGRPAKEAAQGALRPKEIRSDG